MITSEQLKQLKIDDKWLVPLNETFVKYNIATINQEASFIGQCMHESGGFRNLEENLHYSANALMRTWSSRFPDSDTAEKYANNPEKIANKVYAGRMGNIEDGDGFRYRGRGLIGITGRENYLNAGMGIGQDLLTSPDLLLFKYVF